MPDELELPSREKAWSVVAISVLPLQGLNGKSARASLVHGFLRVEPHGSPSSPEKRAYVDHLTVDGAARCPTDVGLHRRRPARHRLGDGRFTWWWNWVPVASENVSPFFLAGPPSRPRLTYPTYRGERRSSSRAMERRWTASGPSTIRNARAQA